MSLFNEICDFFIDPTKTCAGNHIIPSHNFENLVETLNDNTLLEIPIEEALEVLRISSLKFSACGANNGEKYGVLRKNTKTSWKYLENKLKKA